MRRRAVFQRVEHTAEPRLDLLPAVARDREGLVHDLRQMVPDRAGGQFDARSEEHTSELQSLMRISYAVFCLKKKKIKTSLPIYTNITSHAYIYMSRTTAT